MTVNSLFVTLGSNLLAMFGTNPVLLGFYFLCVATGIMIITKTPMILMLPLMFMTMIIVGTSTGVVGFLVITAIVGGFIMAFYAFKLWGR